MKELFVSYFDIFLHPFKAQAQLKKRRVSTGPLGLAEDVVLERERITYFEFLGPSWLMVVMSALYSIAAISGGFYIYNFLGDQSQFSALLTPKFAIHAQKVKLFSIILEVILAPISIWVYVKFWSLIIKFFLQIFSVEGDEEAITSEIVDYSLVGNTFLMIPIFGKVFKFLSSFVYLYAGLKNNAGLTTLQCVLTLAAPFFLITGLMGFLLVYFTFLFSILF